MTLLKALWAYQIAGVRVAPVLIALWNSVNMVIGAHGAAFLIQKWNG